MPPSEEKLRDYVARRVEEAGSVDKAWPRDEFTARAWRELCAHLGIGAKHRASSLDEALAKLAELAG